MKEAVDEWFEECGVPHFIHSYSASKRLPDLCIVLCVVLAFELGVAPWLELDVSQLAVAPIVLLVLTLWARPALLPMFDLEPRREIGTLSTTVRLFLLGVVAGWLIETLSVPSMDAWVNFALLLTTFAAATVLFSKPLWMRDDPSVRRLRRRFVGLLVAGVAIFAVEGSLVARFDRALGDVAPRLGDVPQSVPALVWVVVLLSLALRMSKQCPARQAADEHANPVAGFQLAAVPALLLILGGETAVLPHAAADGLIQAALPLALVITSLLVAAVAAAAIARGNTGTAGASGGEEGSTAATVALCVLALIFAIGYPLLAGVYFTIDAFGTPLDGWDAFFVTFGINLLCLVIGWLFVSLGIDRIAVWTARAAWRSRLNAIQGIARGLPLLLVFTAFFVMQAELWEVVVEIGTLEYLALVAMMVVLAVAFGYVAAHREVVRGSRFGSWRDVAKAGLASENANDDPPPPEPFRSKLEALGAQTDDKPGTPELTGFKYLNAVAVMAVYQTVILLPVALASAGLFWVLGRIAVPSSVAGEWVYGDGAPARLGRALAERDFLEQPWTRVAVVLGAFSALYLAVQILSTADQRKDFFEGADESVRMRLAVRVAYLRLIPPDPVADASHHERFRRELSARLDRAPWQSR